MHAQQAANQQRKEKKRKLRMIIPLGNETENAFHFIVSTNRICGLLIDGNLHCKWRLCCVVVLRLSEKENNLRLTKTLYWIFLVLH